jgi:hypothetical protein
VRPTGFKVRTVGRSRVAPVEVRHEGGVTNPPGDSLITPPSRSSLAVVRFSE